MKKLLSFFLVVFFTAGLFFIRSCQQPGSQDVSGPVVSALGVSPNPTSGAVSIQVTAGASDYDTGRETIASAEYFLNGTSGAATPAAAGDGAFDSVIEQLSFAVDASSLNPGANIIYVRAKDSAGNTGDFAQAGINKTTSMGKPDGLSLTAVSYTLAFSGGSSPMEAVWVEDLSGAFLRTLFVANSVISNPDRLPNWSAKSSGQTNGTSGATKSAGSHVSNWNCTDSAGAVVSAGDYKYVIETNREGESAHTYQGTVALGTSTANTAGQTGGNVTSFSAGYTP